MVLYSKFFAPLEVMHPGVKSSGQNYGCCHFDWKNSKEYALMFYVFIYACIGLLIGIYRVGFMGKFGAAGPVQSIKGGILATDVVFA